MVVDANACHAGMLGWSAIRLVSADQHYSGLLASALITREGLPLTVTATIQAGLKTLFTDATAYSVAQSIDNT